MTDVRFQDFIEQSASVENLRQDFQSGQFVHAYLFVGAAGVGKRTLAALCAQLLYCTGVAKPCGVCEQCQRFTHGNHPDVYTVRPEKSIGVDDIRELIATIQMRAFDGGCKVVFIERADKMTVQAQNCLLRTLEEPPPGTVFFLLCEALGAMLPTIQSRCRVLTLPALAPEALVKRLVAHGIAPERTVLLAELAEGSVGRALAMQQDESYWQLRERVLRLVYGRQQTSAKLAEAAGLKDERARAEQIFAIIESSLRAALYQQLLDKRAPAEAYPEGWRELAQTFSQAALLRLMAACTQSKKWIASNVSLTAALEMWILKLSEEWTDVDGHRGAL